jgi:hypothetical protein
VDEMVPCQRLFRKFGVLGVVNAAKEEEIDPIKSLAFNRKTVTAVKVSIDDESAPRRGIVGQHYLFKGGRQRQ